MTGGVTADDCDDGVSAVDTVEQFMGVTISLVEPQHVLFLLVQIVQTLLLENVILMSDDGVSVFSTAHHLISPAV